MRKILSISLEPKFAIKVEKIAKEHKMTKSKLTKQALTSYLQNLEFNKLRNKGLTFGKKAGFYTDEDIFKAIS